MAIPNKLVTELFELPDGGEEPRERGVDLFEPDDGDELTGRSGRRSGLRRSIGACAR